MMGSGSDRFKMIRRNTLRNEVDGSFDELEEFEDREQASPKGQVTHQECILLNRVLSDKAKLPPVCVPPRKETAQEASSQQRRRRRQQQQLRASMPPEDESAVGGLVRRITGAVQPVLSSLSPLHAPKQEMGGAVTADQCRTLAAYLSPSAGGQYLLPTACSKLLVLNASGDDRAELARAYSEKANPGEDDVRLRRRKTVEVKECFPPTVC
ncbi:unnamed protein product [Scytosiphon promiscuus]